VQLNFNADFCANIFSMKWTLIALLIFFPAVLFAQNVGIGTVSPSAKLQINHRSSLAPGLKLVDSATNIGGTIQFQNVNYTMGMRLSGFSSSNFNNGQYLDFRSDSITAMTIKGNGFVGIRDLNPSYPLDIQGDINTTGLLRLNGNPGTAGQVLTSNGTAGPAWQTLIENYPAADRLMVPIISTPLPSALSFPLNFGTPDYNLNPSNFSVGATSVTINTTGLYEIEGTVTFSTGSVTVSVGTNAYGALTIRTVLGTVTNEYTLKRERIDQFSASTIIGFTENMPYKIKLHIVAGTVISLRGVVYQYSTGSPDISDGYIGIVRIN
jgi:hypothetical protein